MKVTGNLRELTTTQTAFSRAVGLSKTRVNELKRDGVLVVDEEDTSGAILLFESLKNFYLRKAGETSSEEIDFNVEHARLEKLKADKEAIRVAKMEGEIYEAAVVEKAMMDIYVTLRTQLLGLPSKIASQLPDDSRAAVNHLMTKEIENCLSEMARYSPDMFIVEVTDDE